MNAPVTLDWVLALVNVAHLSLVACLLLGVLGRSDFAEKLSMAALVGLVTLGPFSIATYGARFGWTSWVVVVPGVLHPGYVAALCWDLRSRRGGPR